MLYFLFSKKRRQRKRVVFLYSAIVVTRGGAMSNDRKWWTFATIFRHEKHHISTWRQYGVAQEYIRKSMVIF